MSDDVVGWETVIENLSSIEKDLVDRIVEATQMSQAKVVAAAQRGHGPNAHAQDRFQARTGQLEQSIVGANIEITDRNVSAEVVANKNYAEWVEVGTPGGRNRPYPFMFPALVETQPFFLKALTRAMQGGNP